MNTENHRIRQLREAAGLSVDEVAAAVGWHPAILARIERGVRPLRDNEADQITAAIRQIEADTVESQAEKTACVRCGTEPRTSLSTARITIGGADTGIICTGCAAQAVNRTR